MRVVEMRHRWINEDARRLYEAYEAELREVVRKRAVDLGIQMDDGDEKTATELLRSNRRLRMSDEHRAQVWASWQPIVDGLTRRMTDIYSLHTVPEMIVTKPNE